MRRQKQKGRLTNILARILIWAGVLALVASVAGFLFRTLYRSNAEETTGQVLEQLQKRIPEEADQAVRYADLKKGPEALPLLQVSGVVCAGLLSIPNLRQGWPVGGLYESLRKLPCLVRNEACPQLITIEGMDYESQFSILRQLATGDEVLFTDVNGLPYHFIVDYTGTDPGRRESEWDLELLSYMGGEDPYCVGCLLQGS